MNSVSNNNNWPNCIESLYTIANNNNYKDNNSRAKLETEQQIDKISDQQKMNDFFGSQQQKIIRQIDCWKWLTETMCRMTL